MTVSGDGLSNPFLSPPPDTRPASVVRYRIVAISILMAFNLYLDRFAWVK
jgi:hypothetical protein